MPMESMMVSMMVSKKLGGRGCSSELTKVYPKVRWNELTKVYPKEVMTDCSMFEGRVFPRVRSSELAMEYPKVRSSE